MIDIHAAELRVPVSILAEEDPSEDDWAYESDAWVVVGRGMARLKALTGLEALVGEGIDTIQRYECVMRWRNDITTEHVLRDDRNDRRYQIESVVNDDQANKWLMLRVVFNHAAST